MRWCWRTCWGPIGIAPADARRFEQVTALGVLARTHQDCVRVAVRKRLLLRADS
jgi:hypothetical protein